VLFAAPQTPPVHHVDVKDGVERMLVGDIIGGQAGNRDVEIDGVDAAAKPSLLGPPLQQVV